MESLCVNLPKPLQQTDRTYVRSGKRKLSYFAGCDYFRLASDPKVLRALQEGTQQFGLNVAASRKTTGNHEIYGKLENALAKFFGSESALLVANGYVTNLIVAQALAGDFSHVLLDEKAHPSLADAAQFFDCRVLKFQHRNAEDLPRVHTRVGKNSKPILLTDGIFSHDGSIAPLKSYLKLLPKNSVFLVDDAHGAGVLGKTGKGTIELENIPRSRVIQTITLSKAFGVYGGAILCSRALREKIVTRSRMFGGSTPLPLPLASAALASAQILRADKSLQTRLLRNVRFLKEQLRNAGLEVAATLSPILAVVPKSGSDANAIKARCIKNEVFPSFIKYHGGPENGYFRFAISSEHTKKQLNSLAKSLIPDN